MRVGGPSAGFTIVELMIVLVVLGVVLTLGMPSISGWLQNTQIRTAAEGMVSGLQLARAEALRRNAIVRFQLVNNLTAGCALSNTGRNWVISQTDATSACNQPPSEVTPPQIIQTKSSTEGSGNAVIAATGGAEVVFNGLGRPVGAGNLTQIDITNTQGGACQTVDNKEHPMRCLRVIIGTGGGVRMCDPIVADVTDPRICVIP